MSKKARCRPSWKRTWKPQSIRKRGRMLRFLVKTLHRLLTKEIDKQIIETIEKAVRIKEEE